MRWNIVGPGLILGNSAARHSSKLDHLLRYGVIDHTRKRNPWRLDSSYRVDFAPIIGSRAPGSGLLRGQNSRRGILQRTAVDPVVPRLRCDIRAEHKEHIVIWIVHHGRAAIGGGNVSWVDLLPSIFLGIRLEPQEIRILPVVPLADASKHPQKVSLGIDGHLPNGMAI